MSCLSTFLVILSITSFPCESCADSWSSPHGIDALSANGEYKVTVHAPGKEAGSKSSIVVEGKVKGGWNKQWAQTVVNEVMPRKVILNDTGTRVITLGNWYGKEKGNDSLVVYRRDRVLAQYSIADLIKPEAIPKVNLSRTRWLSDSHSGFDENLGFYLWMDFTKKWSVIDMTNGQLRKLTPKLVAQCEDLARGAILSRIKSGASDFSNFKTLSRFMRPGDKELFTRLLDYPVDQLGCSLRHQGNRSFDDYGLIEYFQANRHRDLAEYALDALAEGDTDAEYKGGKKDNYNRLASLQLIAKFDELPKKEDGTIVVWLEPITQQGAALPQTRPAHAIGIDMLWKAPQRYGIPSQVPEGSLPINFHGVTPGRYHVHGFWNKKVKSASEINKDFWTRSGDHIVIEGVAVDLKIGGIVTAEIVFKPLKTQ